MSPFVDEGLCWLAIFVAGWVRGYAGFGFSAVSIGLISLWRAPSALVPIIFLLEVPASLLLLRQALRDYNPRWVKSLMGGSVIGIPLGVGLLSSLRGPWLQLLVTAIICGASLLVRLDVHPRQADTSAYRWLTGLVSGILNGISALGGMACAVMVYSVSIAPHALRATLTLLFLFTDVYGLLLAGLGGLVHPAMLYTAAWWLLPMALGIAGGSRYFHASDLSRFRSRVFALLTVLGAIGFAKALLALL